MRPTLDEIIEEIQVIPPGMWENDEGPPGWWAVSTSSEGGIDAYFATAEAANRFKSNEVARIYGEMF